MDLFFKHDVSSHGSVPFLCFCARLINVGSIFWIIPPHLSIKQGSNGKPAGSFVPSDRTILLQRNARLDGQRLFPSYITIGATKYSSRAKRLPCISDLLDLARCLRADNGSNLRPSGCRASGGTMDGPCQPWHWLSVVLQRDTRRRLEDGASLQLERGGGTVA